MRVKVLQLLAILCASWAPAAEVSTIAVPIRSTLAPLVPLVEAQVPKTYADSRDQNGFKIEYRVTRDPIRLQMIGDELHASTIARYSLQVCRGRLGCVSCGVDEPMREAAIALSARFTWDENWRLRSTTTAEPVAFPNRCEVTFFNFDITDRFLGPVVNDQLRDVANAIDRNTPNLTSIRPSAEQIWSAIQVPTEVAPRTWLVFEALDAGLAPLTGRNLEIETTLSVNAMTRIIVGEKPSPITTPLPALQSRSSAAGLRVPFDIHVGYADATALANQQFGNRAYKLDGDDLRIESITITPAANGKLGVDATIATKHYQGPVHLQGTPRVESNRVSVPDLDYALDPEHKTLFLRAVEGLAHDLIRAHLRESASFSLAQHEATVREEITRALTRQLSPGARMRGQINAVRAESVAAEPDAIVVRVLVTGTAEVEVSGAQPPHSKLLPSNPREKRLARNRASEELLDE